MVFPSPMTYGSSMVRPEKPTDGSGSMTREYVAAICWARRQIAGSNGRSSLLRSPTAILELFDRTLRLSLVDPLRLAAVDRDADCAPAFRPCEDVVRATRSIEFPAMVLQDFLHFSKPD